MSRCFPFPPPGYEKKTIHDDDDVNLIIKEKDKQNKRKDKESGRKRSEYKNEDHQKNRIAESARKNEKKDEKKRKRKEENVSVIDRSTGKIKPVVNGLKFLDFHHNIPSNPLKEGYASHVKLPKRKEPIANGFLHEDGIRPSDISKLASSTLRVCGNENGSRYCKTLAVEDGSAVTYQNSNGEYSSSQSVIINVKNMALGQNGCISTFENGRGPVTHHVFGNGSISSKYVDNARKVEVEPCDAEEPEIDSDSLKKMDSRILRISTSTSKQNTSSNRSSASVRSHDNGGSSVKPHPDSDYLSQILTVPTLEWPQSDDQEWLFGRRNSRTKRTRLASTLVDCTKQVWARALPLDSADVTALPFVTPY